MTSISIPLNVTTRNFIDNRAQAQALAAEVAEHLRSGLKARGHAVLAVSGGITPQGFFAHLSSEPLDWAKVQITLVDERWVPDSDERSNARLVKSLLLQHAASTASLIPLYTGAATPEAGQAEAAARIDALPQPFDVVVLGMGDDGHTASFFPGGNHLADALDPEGHARVLPMRAPTAGEPRITLTLPALLDTRAMYLLVSGEKKRILLDDIRLGLDAARDYPVRAVLTQQRVPVAVYWCP